MNDKPTVAHFHSSFFAGSETFIYQYISNHRSIKPICIAYEFINLDQFHFPGENMYSISAMRYSPAWWYGKLHRRVFKNEPKLTRTLASTGSMLIHAHFGPSGCLALPSKKKLEIPLVTSFYGFDVSKRDIVSKFAERYESLFEEGDLFLAEGPYMKSRVIELGCSPEKVGIQRIGIPVQDIPFRPREPKRRGEKAILLFAGRFVEKKGVEYLIKAVAIVYQQRRDFELKLIGKGPMEERIKKLIEKNGIAENVTFLGFVPYKVYLEELNDADIFVHPSVVAADGDSEGGAPTVILEAQASGLPILATNHADIPNVVEPGKSAILCPERNEEDLAEKIVWLLDNQDAWTDMGQAGRKYVEQKHDIRKAVQELEKKYLRLLR